MTDISTVLKKSSEDQNCSVLTVFLMLFDQTQSKENEDVRILQSEPNQESRRRLRDQRYI